MSHVSNFSGEITQKHFGYHSALISHNYYSTVHHSIDRLAGVNIVGGSGGIHFTFVRDGRPSGEAYIELASEEDVHKACTRDKEHMGKRYIEGMPHTTSSFSSALT